MSDISLNILKSILDISIVQPFFFFQECANLLVSFILFCDRDSKKIGITLIYIYILRIGIKRMTFIKLNMGFFFSVGFTNMDNHGYDGPEDKPKNNNTYTDASMTNGSLQRGWSNGGPG